MSSILRDYDAVSEAISKSKSKKEVLEALNLRAAGGNYKSLDAACLKHGLILPQWDRSSQVRSIRRDSIPDSEVFVENSSYQNRRNLKYRLYKMGIKEECVECGQGPWWNGKPLTLTLDHINGIFNDNRLENLRILCGHCHSQTSTFAGRRFKTVKPQSNPKPRSTKIDWPDNETLSRMVAESNYVQVGLALGVSDNAVRKRLRREV